MTHRAMNVAQAGGFLGQAICRCHWNLRQTDPGGHGNENLGIKRKNGYNSANTRNRATYVAPNMGFSRSGNLPVSLKFISDPPRLLGQRKFRNFNGKIAKTRLIQEIEPQILHQTGGF